MFKLAVFDAAPRYDATGPDSSNDMASIMVRQCLTIRHGTGVPLNLKTALTLSAPAVSLTGLPSATA
jgi:hypothetical protein